MNKKIELAVYRSLIACGIGDVATESVAGNRTLFYNSSFGAQGTLLGPSTQTVESESRFELRNLSYENYELIKATGRNCGLVNTDGEGCPSLQLRTYWYGIGLETGLESLAVILRRAVKLNSDCKKSF